jgi:hypothetical protein
VGKIHLNSPKEKKKKKNSINKEKMEKRNFRFNREK